MFDLPNKINMKKCHCNGKIISKETKWNYPISVLTNQMDTVFYFFPEKNL